MIQKKSFPDGQFVFIVNGSEKDKMMHDAVSKH